MSAGRYSFTIEQGATLDFELAYKDSNNDPINLTGYQGRMQIRPSVGSDNIYITLSSSLEPDGTGLNFSGSDGLNPYTSGTIGIFISAQSSSQLSWNGESVYDLELSTGSEFPIVTRLLEGQVRLSPNVTLGSF
jgi:hypothetical protein|tara:strand:+ start:104 stop:505 length:402 start_codon:yes stop_codon:yes gene_type:complete